MGLRTTPIAARSTTLGDKTTQHAFLWMTGSQGFALGREGELGRGSSALEFTRVRGTVHLAACAQRAVTAHGRLSRRPRRGVHKKCPSASH
jgi:hypothetical protein